MTYLGWWPGMEMLPRPDAFDDERSDDDWGDVVIDDDEPDDDEWHADPLCDVCFGAGGWGSQDTGWTSCPSCFPCPFGDNHEAARTAAGQGPAEIRPVS